MPVRFTTRLRLALYVVLFGLLAFELVPSSKGQSSADNSAGGGSSGTTAVQPAVVAGGDSVFSLIMQNRDPIFYTILALSVTAFTLIIQAVIATREKVFMPPATTEMLRQLIAQRRFQELLDFTETDQTFISRSLNPALKRAPSFLAMKDAMETAVGEQTAEQFRKIEYLNIIGTLGPLLGLLGTVLGMIEAFLSLHAFAGEAHPADLAFGISKALCHTMLGLMLAIPCLAAFGVLRTVVDRLTVRGALAAEELLLMIKPAEARPAVQAARPAAAPQPVLHNPPMQNEPIPLAAVAPMPAAPLKAPQPPAGVFGWDGPTAK